MNSVGLALFLLVNGTALSLMGFDKWQAGRGGMRIPEAVLLFPALFFGAPGILSGMFLFRHKTGKGRFHLKLALAVAGNLGIWYGLR